MLTAAIRGVILYLVSVAAVRLMGKRQAGQLQPYELVMALLIADLAAAPMENVETPLLYGVMPILALLSLHALLTFLDVRFPLFRRVLCAAPSVIIRQGRLCVDEMRRLNYTLSDLLEETRSQGVRTLDEIWYAVLETNGTLSVLKKASDQPLTPAQAGVAAVDLPLPEHLVMDGKVQQDALQRIGKSPAWLMDALRTKGVRRVEDVFLCTLDGERITVVRKGDGA